MQTRRPSCSIALFLLLSASSALAADQTDSVLAGFRANQGLTGLRDTTAAGLTVHLYLTRDSQQLIAAKGFDIADPGFDLAKYTDFVVSAFDENLVYFNRLFPEKRVAELHLIVDDLKEARKGTISETFQLSRVMRLDVRRWHKLFLGYRAFLAGLTSIHEFTHVVNYVADPSEDKYHRELTAIVVEILNFIRTQGEPAFRTGYLASVAGTLDNPEKVKGDAYPGNTALRYIARSLVAKVLEGRYGAPGGGDPAARLSALERFAQLYLLQPIAGREGFDRACADAGLAAGSEAGSPALTLEKIQLDLFAELKGF